MWHQLIYADLFKKYFFYLRQLQINFNGSQCSSDFPKIGSNRKNSPIGWQRRKRPFDSNMGSRYRYLSWYFRTQDIIFCFRFEFEIFLIGSSLAVFTPSHKISTCEILSDGKYVVIALENQEDLITLSLKKLNADLNISSKVIYGKEENEGKTFDLQKQ